MKPQAKQWHLRHFAVPLWLSLSAIVFLSAVGFSSGDAQNLYARLAQSPWLPVLSLGSLLSFLMVCLVAIQGGLVVYMRLSPLFLLLFLFVFLLVGATGLVNSLILLAVFFALGLLDDLYDLRGRHVSKGKGTGTS
jgi:hypothetical protein